MKNDLHLAYKTTFNHPLHRPAAEAVAVERGIDNRKRSESQITWLAYRFLTITVMVGVAEVTLQPHRQTTISLTRAPCRH
ncbi:hypothetical protein SPFM20_00112 [Salmonella phage SPFM20]|nr:hypothetical protein SPFM20_00112 [Salmonella phage SPFM20]